MPRAARRPALLGLALALRAAGLASLGPRGEGDDDAAGLPAFQEATLRVGEPLASDLPADLPSRLKVNLDLPPRERWKAIAKLHREPLIADHENSDQQSTHFRAEDLDSWLAAQHVDEELLEELRGFSEVMNHSAFTMRDMILRQMKYEMGITQDLMCSGIVAAMPNGTVVHGRNLDLGGTHREACRGISLVTFYKNNKPILEAPMHAGTIGIHTGHRVGGYSWQQNTRFELAIKTNAAWVRASILAAQSGGEIFMLQARKIMQDKATYEDALDAFRTSKFTAGSYFMLAGIQPWQGASLTFWRAHHDKMPDLRTLSPENWYLVQTNDDHWTMPLDGRRESGKSSMVAHGAQAVEMGAVRQAAQTTAA